MGEAAPAAISDKIDVTLGNVSYHTRELLDLGFIEVVRTESVRGSTRHVYRAAPVPDEYR